MRLRVSTCNGWRSAGIVDALTARQRSRGSVLPGRQVDLGLLHRVARSTVRSFLARVAELSRERALAFLGQLVRALREVTSASRASYRSRTPSRASVLAKKPSPPVAEELAEGH